MLAPIAVAIFFRYRPQVRYGETWRQRLAYIFVNLQFNKHLLFGAAAILMIVAVFVSMSRGGIISFTLSIFLFLAVFVRRAREKTSLYAVLILLALIFLAVGWFGWDVIDQRFGVMFDRQGNLRETRPLIWWDSINIIKDFPVIGTGWGTLGNIFPTYLSFFNKDFMYHAHNDYIEILANGGIVSLFFLGWFLVVVLRQIFKALIQRKSSFAVYLTWGALTGIMAILIHSFLDFNLQNGANGLYFFLLLSLAVSGSHTHLHGKKITSLETMQVNKLRYISMCCLGFVLGGCLWINGSNIWADRRLVPLTSFNWNGATAEEIKKLKKQQKKNIPISPLNSYTWASRHLAALMPLKWNEETSEEELKNIIDSLDNIQSISKLNSYTYFLMAEAQKTIGNKVYADRNYRKAIRLNPVQASYLQNYGLFLAGNGKFSLADSLMSAGIRHGSSNSDYKLNYAKFLIDENKKSKVSQLMRDIFAQHPEESAKFIKFFADSDFSDKDIRMNMPERVLPFLRFADYLSRKGETEQAAALYRQALTYIEKEKNVRPDYFYHVSHFFINQKRYDEGLEIIQQGIKLFPNEAGFRVNSGKIYQKMGLKNKAVEEYQLALTIDRKNLEAIEQLSKLQEFFK
jgi:Tfp pilus assembly protein PilF